MNEIVTWTCILGFSPIVLAIGLKIIESVAGFSHQIAARPMALGRVHRGVPVSYRHSIHHAGGFDHVR